MRILRKPGEVAVVLGLVCLVFVSVSEKSGAYSGHVRRVSRRRADQRAGTVQRRVLSKLPPDYTIFISRGKMYYIVDSVYYVEEFQEGRVVYVEVQQP